MRARSSRQKRSNILDAASGVSPLPVSSTLTSTSSGRAADEDRDRAVGRGVAQRVREQVVEDALDLLGLAPRPGAVVDARLHADLPRASLGLEASDARLDEAGELGVAQLERRGACVDPRELEEVVHEAGEDPHLLVHRGQVALGPGDPILDRLQHRLQRRDRRAQVVTRPRDELAASVEDPVRGLPPSR